MSLNIALVGFHGSEIDNLAVVETCLFLETQERPRFDIIDLRILRDFLKETNKYDVVVLNYIFNPNEEDVSDFVDHPEPTIRVSEWHSIENWKRRLVKTEAKYILMFGHSESEITGLVIKELPGYTWTARPDLWIYKKI